MAFPDLSDILTRCRSVLNESTAAMWSDAELYTIINDAERDIAVKTGCIENVDEKVTVAGTRTVDYTGYDVKYVEFVPTGGTPVGLRRISINHLGRVKTAGIHPQYYAVWGSKIIIEPKPTKVYALNVCVADYPSTYMSTSTDEPEIQKEFHEDILSYVPYMSLFKPGKFRASQDHYKKYITSLTRKSALVAERDAEREKMYLLPEQILRQEPPQPQRG
jgi:hypothetical protein